MHNAHVNGHRALAFAGNLRDAEPGLPKTVPANTVLQVRLAEPHDARGVLSFAVRRPGAALHALLRDTRRTELHASPTPVTDQSSGRRSTNRRLRRHRRSAHPGLGVVSVVVNRRFHVPTSALPCPPPRNESAAEHDRYSGIYPVGWSTR